MKTRLALAACVLLVSDLRGAATLAQPSPATPATDAGTSDLHALSAQLDSAVARLVQKARDEARTLLAAKNYAGALKALESAHDLDPHNPDATRELADLQVLIGHAERAEKLYRELITLEPERGAAYVALGDLLARDGSAPERLEEAARVYTRARELLGQDPSVLLKQARLAARRGETEQAEYAYQGYLALGHMDDALRLELGDFYRLAGKPGDATRYYREVTGTQSARAAAQRIFELEVDREARRYGLSQHDGAGDAEARALAEQARVQRATGQPAQAVALLRDALQHSPGLASVHADLGDVLRDAERDPEAELEYLRAIALDGTSPDVPLRLAQLYLDAKPAHAVEAALLGERSLQLRPDWAEPELLLSRAYRAQGDLPRALSRVQRFLAQAPEGAEREQALALQAAIETLLGGSAPATAHANDDEKLPLDPLARARVFIARGRTGAALAELQRLGARSSSVEALNLEAELLHATGRSQEAVSALRRSLQQNPGQPEAQEALASALITLGQSDAARPYLADCERARSVGCRFRLAELAAGPDPGTFSMLHDAPQLFDLLHARACAVSTRITQVASHKPRSMRSLRACASAS